jgi:hypothetical protein
VTDPSAANTRATIRELEQLQRQKGSILRAVNVLKMTTVFLS